MEYADPEKHGHGTVPVATYRGREVYRTADRTLVIPPSGHQFCVENLRESDEGPTLHTEASIQDCRDFIDGEIENDWYARRNELQPGMVFTSCYGVVKLDRGVAGDATKWFVISWIKGYTQGSTVVPDHWSHEDSTIEPGDLSARLPDDYAGEAL